MALFEPKMLFFGPSGHLGVQIATGLALKRLPFWRSVMLATKKWDAVPKNVDFGPKNAPLSPKSFFSLQKICRGSKTVGRSDAEPKGDAIMYTQMWIQEHAVNS